MTQAFLIKYGEIAIKGKNRASFEEALLHDIHMKLKRIKGSFNAIRLNGRIFVEASGDCDYDETLRVLTHIFGIVGVCPVSIVEDESMEGIRQAAVKYIDSNYPDKSFTFKSDARRANKKFPIHSMELDAEVGEAILNAFPETRVDVHNPQVVLKIELRERVFIYSRTIKGTGGLPLGTNGRAMLLLSGGFDSPVAGYMIARRGVFLDAVYFNAPPYTSERAKQKVIDLAVVLAGYTGSIRLHIINFTDIQLHIYNRCPHDELTIIMRRYMMKIAQALAENSRDCLALVTGESIGQVASQTTRSLYVTDEACGIPVYRPLIGFDKQDIMDMAEKIGTHDISVLPYEDCCTIFVARHPVTKPRLDIIKASEKKLLPEIDALVAKALETDEIIRVYPDTRSSDAEELI